MMADEPELDFDNWEDQFADLPAQQTRFLERSGMWKTADGRVLKIKDMETSHLVNTMAYLWRVGTLEQFANSGVKPQFYQDKIKELSKELSVRLRILKIRAES
jgi:hypothetical protein